ncbi:Rha family transcriptional regulator [Enterobacter hormaechei]|uniref:Rha family transcriptional regulator n=1 Tax=Enterobacter hormaechei TaxID=158836 RepID=UPI0007B3853B|nr:Rha family transcriptional regulator [Enterobacter hormaechei]KZP84545.1 hypothetical protein A3N47_10120 [Enterobacter hormaechei subsp. xiangfangensis]RTM57480.1 Rha family transcriptional regulator [Enterobacter hormaechei subsp. xiangfangensis]
MMLSTEVRMTSREIAELTGKDHFHVMRDVRAMFYELNEPDKGYIQFWIHPQNKRQYQEFSLDRLHVECLLMGYSATLRMKVLKRLRELESLVYGAKASNVPTLATSSADTIAAGVALLDGSRKLLHISDSSVLAGLRKLQSVAGLPDLLPGYAVDAPPDATGGSSEPTSSLRQLLAEHGMKLSSQKAYARLAELGIVEQKTRTSSRGEKHYWCLTEAGLAYGKNLTSPGNPRATQPHFYESKFSVICKMITNNIQ